jgi:hypothetical protein
MSTKKTPQAQWPNNYQLEAVPVLQGCICDGFNNKKKLELESHWLQMAPKNAFWCICLQERDDRKRESADQFHEFGLCRLMTYFRTARPDEAYCKEHQIVSRGRYGCWTSHWMCVHLSLSHGAKSALVLEDDIKILPQHIGNLQYVAHNITSHLPADCDLMKLGQITFGGQPMESCVTTQLLSLPTLYTSDSCTTHALWWSLKGMKKLESEPFETIVKRQGTEFDIDWWFRRGYSMYACYPQLMCQSGSPTSNLQNGQGWWNEWCRANLHRWGLEAQGYVTNACDMGAYYVIPMLFTLLYALIFVLVIGLVAWLVPFSLLKPQLALGAPDQELQRVQGLF